MKTLAVLVFSALSLFFFQHTCASMITPSNCGSSYVGWQSYNWCIHNNGTTDSGTALYYFHGNGGSEKSWQTPEHEQLAQLWSKHKEKPAAVISVSFGKSWFLNPNLQDGLIRKVIPNIESQLGFPVRRRFLLGESMGGFNAAVVAGINNRTFDKIAILCPAVYNINPYTSSTEINKFIAAQPAGVNTGFIVKWLDKQRDSFRNGAEFAKYDPITSVKQSSAPLFIMGDEADSLGVYEGAKLMAANARAKGINLSWWSIPQGEHCQHSTASLAALAQFLGTP